MGRLRGNLILLVAITVLLSACVEKNKREKSSTEGPRYSPEVTERIRRVENGLAPLIGILNPEELGGDHGQPVGGSRSVRERMEEEQVHAVSIAVIQGGEIEWTRAYGPIDVDTLFQAASIGKTITAVTSMVLVEEGRLGLQEDIRQYLTSWNFPENEFTGESIISLERILSHNAGITVHGFGGYPEGSARPNLIQILNGEGPSNSGPIFVDVAPGSTWRYSGGGYEVLEQAIQDVTGREFPNVVSEKVFSPAGMTRTFYAEELSGERAANYAVARRADGSEVPGGYHRYPEFGAGAGLWTTPTDLARFTIAIQRSIAGEEGSVLGKNQARSMLEHRIGPSGLGFMVRGEGRSLSFNHGGGNVGYRNYMAGFAETGQGAVIMTNSDGGEVLFEEILRSIAEVYDWPDYRPVEKRVVRLGEDELRLFEGRYDVAGSLQLDVILEDGVLTLPDIARGEGRFAVHPESESRFFSPRYGYELEFVRDEQGTVASVDISFQEMKYTAARIR